MIQGAAGPGGCDATHWQDSLLRYGAHSEKLRVSVAALTRRMTNSIVPWEDIKALLANRLIALDKCPGIRPIGVGESLRRVIGKAVCMATRHDIEEISGVSQLCNSSKAGIEGAIHAVNELFDEHKNDGWGVLLIDATNAFNSLNRIAALWNVRKLWPRCSRFLFNTYRGWAALIVSGSASVLYSREDMTQGDPLFMFMYAVSTIPLISSLDHLNQLTQVWYADDASACGDLHSLSEWLLLLMKHGPSYGYFPEPTKSYLVVDKKFTVQASKIFDQLGIKVVHSRRFLGGVIGDKPGKSAFVSDLTKKWVSKLKCLTMIATTQPQAAYAALTKSLQHEWSYIQRVVPGCESSFHEIEHMLANDLLPTIFGCEVSPVERELFTLPARMGGLGIVNPTEMCDFSFTTSRKCSDIIVQAIKGEAAFEVDAHAELWSNVKSEMQAAREQQLNSKFDSILNKFDQSHQRAIRRAKDTKISSWLTVVPAAKSHFDLSAQEFRDALAIRYKKPLLRIPVSCDGCGSPFSLSHALLCRKGGLVIQRHNEVRDVVVDISAMVWRQVKHESVVKEADVQNGTQALIADLAVRGVWVPQAEALFDIRVVDTDAQSYSHSLMEVLSLAEKEEKGKYAAACEDRRALFTPLVCSVDGLLGKEAHCFIRRLGERLAAKWERSYCEVMGWVRARLSFAILRATIMCLRGSRVKWRSLGVEDGAPIGLFME